MAGEHLPGGVELRADRLGDADHDAADQRAPQAAEAAEHHRLEGGQQAARAGGRIEIGPHRHEARRDRHGDADDAHGDGVDFRRRQADEVRGRDAVGHRADAGADPAAVEQQVEAPDHRDCRHEDDQRQHADVDVVAEMQRRGLDGAAGDLADIGAVDALQAVLDDDRQAEGDEDDRQHVLAEHALQQQPLQQVAAGEGEGQHDRDRGQRRQAEALGQRPQDEGDENDQVAVGDVDEAHDADRQRQPHGEQRIQPAHQDALHDLIEPDSEHGLYSPK